MDANQIIETARVELPERGDGAAMLGMAQLAGRPARIKFGMDPTAPDLHLGHMAVLQRLRQLQDLGHTVVLIIGDFTARVGDPSGRTASRPMLTDEQVKENAKTFCDQAFLILDRERTEIRFNSEWHTEAGAAGMLTLLSQATVSQMLQRKDFADRIENEQPVSLLELTYPLLQGHDSVQVQADIEVGGQDQLLNLLAGRDAQREAGQLPQVVLCWPLLVGIDGSKKMSKTAGNHIALTDDPEQQFGKVMSISDETMMEWAKLLNVQARQGKTFEDALANGVHPMDLKMQLGREIIRRLHDNEAAVRAAFRFEQVFRRRRQPVEVRELDVARISNTDGRVFLPELMVKHMGAPSNSQARNMIRDGAFRIDDTPHRGPLELDIDELRGREIRLGRKHWFRIV